MARIPRPAQSSARPLPGQKLYVVLDNFSPHKHAKIRAWVADNDVELVFLPTYGSWLNWIGIGVRSPALLRAQRHRPSQPRRAERCHRRLRPLA
ncbi:transposase [Streptomyces sp. NPDC058405]|uniref:transposase n=1 Tax=Streptomyces sp. NPDC058405 TaxID=3346482 RepID=UPI0036533519